MATDAAQLMFAPFDQHEVHVRVADSFANRRFADFAQRRRGIARVEEVGARIGTTVLDDELDLHEILVGGEHPVERREVAVPVEAAVADRRAAQSGADPGDDIVEREGLGRIILAQEARECGARNIAVAKIAGTKLCQAYRRQYGRNFISAMPTNLYGPNDNFDLTSSHVLPALMRKFHDAKHSGLPEVSVWGSGRPRREFLHVDDLADACLFLMEHYDAAEHINVGTGEDLSIRELADMVREIVHPAARLVFDAGKPDGTPKKLLDVSRLHQLGWRHDIELRQGIADTYQWFVAQTVAAA